MSKINNYFIKYYRPFLLISIGIALCSCANAKTIDISSESTSKAIVGEKIKLKEDIWAIGGSYKTPARPPADFVHLVPGIANYTNRFVVSRDILKKGSILKVIAVENSDGLAFKIFSGLFGANYRKLVVAEIDKTILPNRKIYISLGRSNKNLGLDSRFFEIIGQSEQDNLFSKTENRPVEFDKGDLTTKIIFPEILGADAKLRGFIPIVESCEIGGEENVTFRFGYFGEECLGEKVGVYLARRENTGDDIWLVIYSENNLSEVKGACASEVNLGAEYNNGCLKKIVSISQRKIATTEKNENIEKLAPSPGVLINFNEKLIWVFCFMNQWYTMTSL